MHWYWLLGEYTIHLLGNRCYVYKHDPKQSKEEPVYPSFEVDRKFLTRIPDYKHGRVTDDLTGAVLLDNGKDYYFVSFTDPEERGWKSLT